ERPRIEKPAPQTGHRTVTRPQKNYKRKTVEIRRAVQRALRSAFQAVCPHTHTTARNSPAADTIAVDSEREKRRATEAKTRRDAGLNSKTQLSRSQRQREITGAPLSFLALNPYLSAVGFDDHLADHEAETGPFLVGHSRVATLAILGKEMTQLVRRYPVTAISHPHVRLGCIHTPPSDLHLASFPRELEGV